MCNDMQLSILVVTALHAPFDVIVSNRWFEGDDAAVPSRADFDQSEFRLVRTSSISIATLSTACLCGLTQYVFRRQSALRSSLADSFKADAHIYLRHELNVMCLFLKTAQSIPSAFSAGYPLRGVHVGVGVQNGHTQR